MLNKYLLKNIALIKEILIYPIITSFIIMIFYRIINKNNNYSYINYFRALFIGLITFFTINLFVSFNIDDNYIISRILSFVFVFVIYLFESFLLFKGANLLYNHLFSYLSLVIGGFSFCSLKGNISVNNSLILSSVIILIMLVIIF